MSTARTDLRTDMATPATTTTPHRREVDVTIGGMTCASCSARIERKLNKLTGVEATVNLATERAHIRYADPLGPRDLLTAIEQTGPG